MKFIPHNIAASFLKKERATRRSHKISAAENSKGHVKGAVYLFFLGSTTLDSFLVTAAGCLTRCNAMLCVMAQASAGTDLNFSNVLNADVQLDRII